MNAASTRTAPQGIRHDFAEVNGVRLHYAAAGTGRLILFLHGFPEFWYAWKDQLAEFGRDHFAVAPDLRGYNLSSKPAEVEEYEVPRLVEDVCALAAHLGHRQFTLVGHDWGGAVAWATALLRPECVEKLVIINAPHPGVFARELAHNPAQQQASQYMLTFQSPQAEAFLAANDYASLVEVVLGEGLRAGYFTADDRIAYLAAWSQPGALTGGLNYYRTAQVRALLERSAGSEGSATDAGKASSPDWAALGSLSVAAPTLVIWGEGDRYLLPGNLEGLEAFVPDLKIVRVADASHWIVHEKPALVNRAIREFLGRER